MSNTVITSRALVEDLLVGALKHQGHWRDRRYSSIVEVQAEDDSYQWVLVDMDSEAPNGRLLWSPENGLVALPTGSECGLVPDLVRAAMRPQGRPLRHYVDGGAEALGTLGTELSRQILLNFEERLVRLEENAENVDAFLDERQS